MNTIATVVMVINMMGTPSADVNNIIVKAVGQGEAAARQCVAAARGTADSLGSAGVDAIVSCAYYEGESTTDIAVIETNTFAAYKSITTKE